MSVQEIVAVTKYYNLKIDLWKYCVIHKSCKKIAFCYFAKIVLGNGVAVLLQIYIRTLSGFKYLILLLCIFCTNCYVSKWTWK